MRLVSARLISGARGGCDPKGQRSLLTRRRLQRQREWLRRRTSETATGAVSIFSLVVSILLPNSRTSRHTKSSSSDNLATDWCSSITACRVKACVALWWRSGVTSGMRDGGTSRSAPAGGQRLTIVFAGKRCAEPILECRVRQAVIVRLNLRYEDAVPFGLGKVQRSEQFLSRAGET